MKSKIIVLFMFLLSAMFLFGQESNQKSVSITVYNNNLGVVKDLRTLDIASGISTIKLTDVAELIDPTSVHIGINGEVLEQNFQYDLVRFSKILGKYIDKNIQLISPKGELIEGVLLTAEGFNIVLQKKDGGLLMLPDISDHQISVNALPEGLITKPTLVWLLNSKSKGKQDVEVSYQTGGMNWHAEYVAVLNKNDDKLDLNSWVSVDNNSGATYKNAKLKLVAGDVNIVYQQPQRQPMMNKEFMVTDSKPQFSEGELFEYHIYNLDRPTTLNDSETKQISLFEAKNVKINKKYFYLGGSYYGNRENDKVTVILEFDNSESNNLGIPMPKGKVRVYKSDGDAIEFIGEDFIDHTAKNSKLNLEIGKAFDITIDDKQTDNITISDRVNEQKYEVKIKNEKKEDIVVDVERVLGQNWTILNSSLDFEKLDSQRILFKVPVKANSDTTLKYKVRYNW